MDNIPDIPAPGGMDGAAPPNNAQIPEDGHVMQNGAGFQHGPGGLGAVSDETQLPDEMRGQNGKGGGNRGDGSQFTQWGQHQDRPQEAAASGISTVSLDTLALVGASILALLVGILAAF